MPSENVTKTAVLGSNSTAAASARATIDRTSGWFLIGCLGETDRPSKTFIRKVPFSIGRAAGSDFCLPSLSVSKIHADIIVAVDAVLVRDLGSTNGTFVNGRQIVAPTPVGEGDVVQFADLEFRIGRANSVSGERAAISNRPEDGWLISRVHEVVNLNRFNMAFQPIVAACDMRPMGVEALVRCNVSGLESPVSLFKAAALLGLEERLSVLCRAKAVNTLAEHPSTLLLFLNTHPSEHLGRDLLDSLGKLRSVAAPRGLILEIHAAAIPEMSAMREFRSALRDLKIGLAYGNFAAGESRLLEPTEAPPDYLKFDRSLLHESAIASADHRALLQTLLKHARDAGTATVAEGLETRESVEICRALGFTHFQGFYLGVPVAPEQLPRRASR